MRSSNQRVDLPERFPSHQIYHRRIQSWVNDERLKKVLKTLAENFEEIYSIFIGFDIFVIHMKDGLAKKIELFANVAIVIVVVVLVFVLVKKYVFNNASTATKVPRENIASSSKINLLKQTGPATVKRCFWFYRPVVTFVTKAYCFTKE